MTNGSRMALHRPCGRSNTAPVLCAMLCEMPSSAFENAIPARHWATCIFSRAFASPWKESNRLSKISEIACSASGSEKSERLHAT